MRWSTINGGDYASYYQTEAAQRENTYIQRFLWKWLRGSEVVVDYGCGTGLAKRLISEWARDVPRVIGVDIDPGFNPDVLMSAREYTPGEDGAVSLFAAEEIGVKAMRRIVRAAKRAVVVFFRWAPNSQASWYSGRPIRFMLKARLKPWRLRRMFEREGLYLYPLNHEKAYWVAVKGPRTIREVQDG